MIETIWNFVLCPTKDYSLVNPLKRKLSVNEIFKTLMFLYAILFLSYLPIIGLVKLIDGIYSIDLIKIRDNNVKNIAYGPNLLIIMVLLGPIFEETMFRLWLSFKKTHVILSLIAIFWFLLTEFNHRLIYSQKIDHVFFLNLIIAVLLAFIIGYIIFSFPFQKFVAIYFKFFYWFSCIGFGLMHIMNFHPLKLNIFWIYPFLVIPQIIAGFSLGYFRVKNGFFTSLLFHCLINLPAALIYYFRAHN